MKFQIYPRKFQDIGSWSPHTTVECDIFPTLRIWIIRWCVSWQGKRQSLRWLQWGIDWMTILPLDSSMLPNAIITHDYTWICLKVVGTVPDQQDTETMPHIGMADDGRNSVSSGGFSMSVCEDQSAWGSKISGHCEHQSHVDIRVSGTLMINH